MELYSSAKRHTLGSFRPPFRRMDSRSLFMAIAGSYEEGSRGGTGLSMETAFIQESIHNAAAYKARSRAHYNYVLSV